MITIEKILCNFFHQKNISRKHLLTFSKDELKRLISANKINQFDAIIAYLTPLITAFSDEISNEDTDVNVRLGETKSVDQVTADFSATMSARQGGIYKTFGSKTSKEYLEFYPKGLKEYSIPGREDMTFLTKRIGKAALKHANALGPVIAAELQAFEPAFTAARGSQTTVIADIATDRSAITTNQLALEIGLTKSIHGVGDIYPGDIISCTPLFNFNLLYPVTQHPHLVLTGVIAVSGLAVLLNKILTDNSSIEIKCTGINASLWLWLGATATDTDDRMAINVGPGPIVTIKPSDIGDLKKTFLLMKNDSSVNTASYEVTIIG